MAVKRDKRGLGRGLSALMADIEPTPIKTGDNTPAPDRSGMKVPIEMIRPNPHQPRRNFSEEALGELAVSIQKRGVIQPLVLRPDPGGNGRYQIVAGERRWRAAQKARLHEVPAIIRDFNDTEVLEVAIIENIQRTDLNPLEEAAGYRQLMDRFGHTQEKLAEAMGKSRSYIANLMRLLNLPDAVQAMVKEGHLSASHARALITADDPLTMAKQVISKTLSVRDVEAMIKPRRGGSVGGAGRRKDADTLALESDLSTVLEAEVFIDHDASSGGGKLSIKYKSLAKLDDIVRILNRG
ncbi:MAG: ParB/RepB/Spo0J family partition protein [Rhodobacteraceae bacterium]|nr:ParB/RepB/Spo0J family partition protein [Paracoccaceae bacterium]